MADLRSIVDEIRSILYSDVDPDPDRLEMLVGAHTSACEETNRLLRDCDDLLHRGLRDEAIQRADASDLLDRVALLDFPEQEQWADYISICGFAVPQAIEVDRAGDLNEAYDAQQPLEPLMRLHRLHALARSPLSKRIAILRRIESSDRDNPIWSRSIREFEQERQKQIKAEARFATKAQDVKSLASLEREVRSSDWSTKVSKSLLKQVVDDHTRLREARARKELHRLQPELNESYAEFDLPRARQVRARWNALAAIADLDDGDSELLDLVRPALAWLSEQDASEASRQEYDTNLSRLRAGLEDWIHTQEEYESMRFLEESLIRSDEGIPDVDRARLKERYRAFEKQQADRHRWKVIGIVSAVVLMAVLTGGSVLMFLRSQEVSNAVASLQTLINDGNLEGAQTFVESMQSNDRRMAKDSRMLKLRSELGTAVQEEENRRGRFESQLQEARFVGLEDSTWESIAAAREILASAGEIAGRESEALAFNELGLQLREAERQMLKTEQENFLEASEELWRTYEAIPSEDMDKLRGAHQKYSRLLAWEHVPEEVKRTHRDIHQRIEGQIEELQRMQGQRQVFQQITDAVGDRRRFETRLGVAKSERWLVDSPQGQSIADVLSTDAKVWVGVEAWNTFNKRVDSADLSTLQPDKARELIAQATKLLADHSGYPAEAKTMLLLEILQPIARRAMNGGQRFDEGVDEALRNPTVADVYYLKTMNDEWYYGNEKPVELGTGGYYRTRYFKNLNLDTAGKQVQMDEIANPRSGMGFEWHSPQSRFSKEALPMHRSLNQKLENWDGVYLQLLDRLFNDDEMDPVFKYQLLQAIIDPALQGSWPLQQGFQRHRERLLAGTVNTQENYFDPSKEEAAMVRQSASRVLENLSDIKASIDASRAAMNAIADFSIGRRFDWLGWLHMDRNGDWVCDIPDHLNPEQADNGELSVIFGSHTPGPPQRRPIGKLTAGRVELNPAAEDVFKTGRPVFVSLSDSR